MTPPDSALPWEEGDDANSERAAEFFERQRFGDWTDVDQAEFDAWLAGSTSHHVAWLRVRTIAARADRFVAVRRSEREQTVQANGRQFDYRRFVVPLLAAASVALAATFGGRFVAYLLQPTDRADSTDVGGRTLLTYSDHTQIELNTDTAVRVRMTTAERTVWLDKGEAWFHVSHDAAHPFTVIVGQHRVNDLGTEFLVRRDASGVDVTLLNGRATLSGGSSQSAMLKPGDEAIATPATLSVTRKTPKELSDELAWRRGMLVFRNAPLSEVVREFNRYNTTKLVVADPSIADLKIAVSARTDDYESFLQFAEDALKLHVDRRGGVILISRGQREEKHRTVRHKRSP